MSQENNLPLPSDEAGQKTRDNDQGMILEQIVANTNAMLRFYDAEGNCRFVNHAWIDFTCCPPNSDHQMTENMHPDFTEAYMTERKLVTSCKSNFSTSYLLLHKSGQYRWINEHSRPVYLSDGQFIGYISTGVDMHDHASHAGLFSNKWNSTLRTYLHDLRGNVGIISAAASLLEMMEKEPDRANTIEMIRRNSKQMQHLMDKLQSGHWKETK